jgi:hypothetical protein
MSGFNNTTFNSVSTQCLSKLVILLMQPSRKAAFKRKPLLLVRPLALLAQVAPRVVLEAQVLPHPQAVAGDVAPAFARDVVEQVTSRIPGEAFLAAVGGARLVVAAVAQPPLFTSARILFDQHASNFSY